MYCTISIPLFALLFLNILMTFSYFSPNLLRNGFYYGLGSLSKANSCRINLIEQSRHYHWKSFRSFLKSYGSYNLFEPLYDEMFNVFVTQIKLKDFEKCRMIYNDLNNINIAKRSRVLPPMLSVCVKAEHLDFVNEIFESFEMGDHFKNETSKVLKQYSQIPYEALYLALIRCHCDAGNIQKSLGLIEEMRKKNLEPRLRSFHPIIEAYCNIGDFDSAITLMMNIMAENISPKPEHIALILESASKFNFLSNNNFIQQFNKLFTACSQRILGFQYEDILRTSSTLLQKSIEEISQEGILLYDLETIQSQIITCDSENPKKVTAYNAALSEPKIIPNELPSLPFNDSTDLFKAEYSHFSNSSTLKGLDKFITWVPENFTEIENKESIGKNPKISQLVEVSNTDCLCPNCGNTLSSLPIVDEDRTQIREALLMIAGNRSQLQLQYLQNFSSWLQSREDFDYIVDGANVGYNKQNFESGKFSFQQVEMVLDKLIAEKKDSRILVLLPSAYAGKVVPNSVRIKGKKTTSNLSKDDMRILSRLQNESYLYTVPQRANDDWYWLYVTVAENRRKKSFVVTNDLIRDHRLAFSSARSYIRWKGSHVIHFEMSAAVENDSKEGIEVELIEPDNFSREIQQSADGFWHIPCTDRRVWMCLNLKLAMKK